RIISPCMNGVYAWIAIDDHALGWLTINCYDWISASSRTTCRDQLSSMFFNDFSGLRQILLRVSLRVGNFDLPDEVDGRFRLRMKPLQSSAAGRHAGRHHEGRAKSR